MNELAITLAYPKLREIAVNKASRRLNSVADAEDALHNALVSALSAEKLKSVVAYCTRALWVQTTTMRRDFADARTVFIFEEVDAPGDSDVCYVGDVKRVIEDALGSLPEAEAAIWRLSHIEKMTAAEIGFIFGCGKAAMQKRIQRINAKVLPLIKELFPEV